MRTLEPLFPGTKHVTDIPGLLGDKAIWEHARSNGFVLVTLDTDFVQIAALHGAPPKIILYQFLVQDSPKAGLDLEVVNARETIRLAR